MALAILILSAKHGQEPHHWALADAQNDIDQGAHIGDIHLAVAVHIGYSCVHGGDAHDHVDEGGHITHIHLAVAVHIASKNNRDIMPTAIYELLGYPARGAGIWNILVG